MRKVMGEGGVTMEFRIHGALNEQNKPHSRGKRGKQS